MFFKTNKVIVSVVIFITVGVGLAYSILFLVLLPLGAKEVQRHKDVQLPALESKKTEETGISIFAVGDIMLDRGVRLRSDKLGEQYPTANLNKDLFFNSDIVIGNLEGAISKRRAPEKLYDFVFDASSVSLLKNFNFTAFNLANNHALDQGDQGFIDTKKVLENENFGFFGDPLTDSGLLWQTTVNNKKIAFLGYSIVGKKFDEEKAESAIKEAVASHDLVIVSVHCGEEYQPLPSAYQKYIGRKFIDWGASAVIGHHPHIIEGMEIWKDKPIFWSLGNFIFDQDWSKETQQGMAIKIVVDKLNYEFILYPVIIEKGQVSFAEGENKVRLVKLFIDRSELNDAMIVNVNEGVINYDK